MSSLTVQKETNDKSELFNHLEREELGAIYDSKEVHILHCIHLAEAKRYSESLRLLYNTFSNHAVNIEDIYHITKTLVDKLRQDVDKINRDPLLCPLCYGVLYEAVTFSCAHTYCGACNTRVRCVICGKKSPVSEHKRNILISSLVKQIWREECQAVQVRNDCITKLSEGADLDELIPQYDGALQQCEYLIHN